VSDIYKEIKEFFITQQVLYGPTRPLTRAVVEEVERDEGENVRSEEKNASESGALHTFHGEINQCQKCALGSTRTHFVFGSGNPHADLMLIGEAPGRDEDLQGKPFVGRAGQLLTLMLQAIGLRREDVYIANVLKCRPPNNRDPLPEEIAKCEPYLLRQIELIEPRLIVALGRIASASLLRTNLALGKLREEIHRYNEVPLIVTYHPAALLRNPQMKRNAWEDLKKVSDFLAKTG